MCNGVSANPATSARASSGPESEHRRPLQRIRFAQETHTHPKAPATGRDCEMGQILSKRQLQVRTRPSPERQVFKCTEDFRQHDMKGITRKESAAHPKAPAKGRYCEMGQILSRRGGCKSGPAQYQSHRRSRHASRRTLHAGFRRAKSTTSCANSGGWVAGAAGDTCGHR